MDELARLMDELSLALKARAEAGQRTEALAQEVQTLPKLSVLVPNAAALAPESDTAPKHQQDDFLQKLGLQLELQNLSHAKQQALEFLQAATETVSQVRQAVSLAAVQSDFQCVDILDDYENRIQYEKNTYAELQQQKQDLLFDLMKRSAKLEDLNKLGDKILNAK